MTSFTGIVKSVSARAETGLPDFVDTDTLAELPPIVGAFITVEVFFDNPQDAYD